MTQGSSIRQQRLRAREAAIVAAVGRLLAEKGFEAMTVDEVAADVGLAKASVYKHFRSKEALAAAAMVRVLERALAFLDEEAARPAAPIEHLRAAVRWMLQAQLAGEMPSLPAQGSTLRGALRQHRAYLDRVLAVGERLGGWIAAARAAGELNPRLPTEAVLYTLYARAWDPALPVLRAGGELNDEQVIEVVLATCFEGLAAR